MNSKLTENQEFSVRYEKNIAQSGIVGFAIPCTTGVITATSLMPGLLSIMTSRDVENIGHAISLNEKELLDFVEKILDFLDEN